MPSLQALGEFKSSFYKLGDEEQILLDLKLTPDDLPLPNHEPAQAPDYNPMDSSSIESDELFSDSMETDADDSGTDFINSGDLGDLLGDINGQQDTSLEDDFGTPEEAGNSQEDTEFSNFIDAIPDDLGEKETPEEEVPEEEVPEEEVPEELGLPPGLLNGFADEIEAERSSTREDETELWGVNGTDSPPEISDEIFDEATSEAPEEFPDLPSDDFESQDFGIEDFSGTDLAGEGQVPQGLGNIDMDLYPSIEPEKSVELLQENAKILPEQDEIDTGDLGENLGDMGFGDESFPEAAKDENLSDLGLDDFPDFDTDETPAADNELALESGESEAVGADFEEALFGEDPGTDDSSFGMAEDSFNMGEESQDFDSGAVLEEISGDSFDNFSLDNSSLAGDFNLPGGGTEDFGDGLGSLDDFSLSGIDSVFDGKSQPARGAADRSSGKSARSFQAEDEVEEIRLTNEELEQFQATLSAYPLNLRIACEELIAEQAVAPDLMSRLVRLLIKGASAKETAALAGQILGRTIPIPKGFEKKTGEELEAEQASFAYIFVHNFLPVFRLILMIALVALSAGYLTWRFIYTPLRAEKIYQLGYERIGAGEYARANERFMEAFRIHEKKSWFYEYARAFRDAKQYTLAEDKYRELLYYTASKNKRYIPEKKAVLEFADMETNTIGNYESAEEILLHNLIDYYPFDREGLLALGDNSLAWGESEPSRLENAREYFARYMERYGRSDPLMERMLKYFIRTDNLEEVLQLQAYFMGSSKRNISSAALAELGGYLLDKRYEKVRGVPNQYLDSIGGIREILLRAVRQDPMLPESYYHLARYYNYYDNAKDERLTLELAVRVFDAAKEESPKRIRYHILTLGRYGELLIENREFFPAEDNLIKGVNLFQDGLSRRLLKASPEFGKLYASLGDLEYFVKDGDMRSALDYYRLSEQYGWAPPEIQYRMGAAHYQLRQWGPALERIFAASREMAPNRRILYALGNVSYMRGNYFAAQGYYDRLLEILEADRSRLPPIMPTDDEKQLDLVERLMVAQNNQGVTLEGLTERTGNNRYRSRAQGLYADSQRAWDILTRNPVTMTRMRPSPEITAPGINPAYLNVQNSLHPVPGYEAQFFLRIDKDILEPSAWEDLAPPGYRLSEGLYSGR